MSMPGCVIQEAMQEVIKVVMQYLERSRRHGKAKSRGGGDLFPTLPLFPMTSVSIMVPVDERGLLRDEDRLRYGTRVQKIVREKTKLFLKCGIREIPYY